MILARELNLLDICIAGFAGLVGVTALNSVRDLWRCRRGGGLLLDALIVMLAAFTLWTLEGLFTSLFAWWERTLVSPIVQGMANLELLTLSVPMGVLLICILPFRAKVNPQRDQDP